MASPPISYAPRWEALLAEHRALDDELNLAAAFAKPLSRQQIAQVENSAERLKKLSEQIRLLVDEWAAAHG
jgi:hypothetical protein